MVKTQMIRYSHPTKYDLAPYGTMWRAIGDEGRFELYIQVSDDQDNPTWVSIPAFFEKVFIDFTQDPKFMDECLILYKENVDKSVAAIQSIMNIENN